MIRDVEIQGNPFSQFFLTSLQVGASKLNSSACVSMSKVKAIINKRHLSEEVDVGFGIGIFYQHLTLAEVTERALQFVLACKALAKVQVGDAYEERMAKQTAAAYEERDRHRLHNETSFTPERQQQELETSDQLLQQCLTLTGTSLLGWGPTWVVLYLLLAHC
jgi:hypothetical protein